MVKFYSLSISLSHNICLGDEENQARKHDEYKLILQFAPAEFALSMPTKFPVKATRAGASKKPEQKTREGWQKERFKPFRLPVFLQPSMKKKKKNQPINSLIRPLRVGMYGCLSHTVSLLDTHTYKTRPHLHADTCQGAPTSLSCKVSRMHAC